MVICAKNNGRPIKDFILVLSGCYIPHPNWSDTNSKSGRFTSQKVGQDSSHHWGPPTWPICNLHVDGSSRINLRNHKFLRRYVPSKRHNLDGQSMMTSDISLSTHQACRQQQPVYQQSRHSISQTQNPAQQGQFPMLPSQHTPAPATQNQQLALHRVLPEK